jgi:hypothetical protein
MSDDLETELNKIICTQIGVFPFIVFGFVFMSELRVCVCDGSHCDQLNVIGWSYPLRRSRLGHFTHYLKMSA